MAIMGTLAKGQNLEAFTVLQCQSKMLTVVYIERNLANW